MPVSNIVDFGGTVPHSFDYSSYFTGPSTWLHKRHIVEKSGHWPHHNQTVSYLDQDMQRRIAQHNFKMSGSAEPSVLKFYAKEWKILSKKTLQFPQKTYLDKIIANPQALQLELLKKVADQYGHEIYNRHWGGFSTFEVLKMLIWRPFRRWVIWPAQNNIPWIKKIMISRMLRFRRRRDQLTGKAEHKMNFGQF